MHSVAELKAKAAKIAAEREALEETQRRQEAEITRMIAEAEAAEERERVEEERKRAEEAKKAAEEARMAAAGPSRVVTGRGNCLRMYELLFRLEHPGATVPGEGLSSCTQCLWRGQDCVRPR